MKLTEGVLTPITYTSESKNETTERVIVPVSVPKDTIRAIDVSGMNDDDQQAVASLVAEYKEYLAGFYKGAFNFEDWASHTREVQIQPKWRTFKVSNVEVNVK